MLTPLISTREDLNNWTRSEAVADTLKVDRSVLLNLAFNYDLDTWLANTFARVRSGLHVHNSRTRDALDIEILHTLMRNGWAETAYPGHFQKLYASTAPFDWNYVSPPPSGDTVDPTALDSFAVYDRLIGFGLQQATILFNALPVRDQITHWLELMSGTARAALSLQQYYPDLVVTLVDNNRTSLLHASAAPWRQRPALLLTDVLKLTANSNFRDAPPRQETLAFIGKQSVSYFNGQQIDTLLAGARQHARWLLLELTGLEAPYRLAVDFDLTTPLLNYYGLEVGYEAQGPNNPITGRSHFALVARDRSNRHPRTLFTYDWHTWQPCQVWDWAERRGWSMHWWSSLTDEWLDATTINGWQINDPGERNFILLDIGE